MYKKEDILKFFNKAPFKEPVLSNAKFPVDTSHLTLDVPHCYDVVAQRSRALV